MTPSSAVNSIAINSTSHWNATVLVTDSNSVNGLMIHRKGSIHPSRHLVAILSILYAGNVTSLILMPQERL